MSDSASRDTNEHPAAARSSGLGWLLALCLVLGLALRAVEAEHKSLWLDEYHTLHLADSDTLGEVAKKVRSDLHPPLFFWLLSLVRGLDGHTQRWLPIILSLLTVLPLWSIVRAAGLGGAARVTVCGLFLFVPYQVQYGAELRAYSALQLVAVTLVWAAVTPGPRWPRLLAFGAATAAGLYMHYFTAVAVVCVGAARCVVRSPGGVSLKGLILAGTVGALLFLPWVQRNENWFFDRPAKMLSWPKGGEKGSSPEAPEREAPDEPSTSPAPDYDWTKAAAALPRTLVPMMGSLGPPFAGVIRIATAILLAALAVAALRLLLGALRREPRAGPRAAWGAVLTCVLGYAVTSALCLIVWHATRLQYFIVAAWVLPLVAGMGVQCMQGRWAMMTAGALLASALTAGACHALGAPREDTEQGVRIALDAGRGRDAFYTAVLWQPGFFPHALPFRYAAHITRGQTIDFREPKAIPPGDTPEGRRPVLVVTRKTAPEGPRAHPGVWDDIGRGRHLDAIIEIDDATRVYIYELR